MTLMVSGRKSLSTEKSLSDETRKQNRTVTVGNQKRYRGVIPDLNEGTNSERANGSGSLLIQVQQIPRPHRKDLMKTLFRDTTALDIANVAENRRQRGLMNSVVAAIDVPRTHLGELVLRPPPKVPASYMAALTDLSVHKPELVKSEKEKQIGEEDGAVKTNALVFRFAPDVGREARAPSKVLLEAATVLMHETVPPNSGTNNQLVPKARQHAAEAKAIWERTKASAEGSADDVDTEETESDGGLDTGDGRKTLRSNAHQRFENCSTRNVPFMLQIWKNNEQKANIDEEQQTSMRKEGRKRTLGAIRNASRMEVSSLSASKRRGEETGSTEKILPGNILAAEPARNSILAHQKLSLSTDNLLRRIALKDEYGGEAVAQAQISASLTSLPQEDESDQPSAASHHGDRDGNTSKTLPVPKSIDAHIQRILTGARAEALEYNVYMPGSNTEHFHRMQQKRVRSAGSTNTTGRADGLQASGTRRTVGSMVAFASPEKTKQRIEQLMQDSLNAVRKSRYGSSSDVDGGTEKEYDQAINPKLSFFHDQMEQASDHLTTVSGCQLSSETAIDASAERSARTLASASDKASYIPTFGHQSAKLEESAEGKMYFAEAEGSFSQSASSISSFGRIQLQPSAVTTPRADGYIPQSNKHSAKSVAKAKGGIHREDFTLSRLAALVKINDSSHARHFHNQTKYPLDQDRSKTFSRLVSSELSLFLSSLHAQITTVPSVGSEARTALFDALLLAMQHRDRDDRNESPTSICIRHEAARLVGILLNHGTASEAEECPEELRETLVRVYAEVVGSINKEIENADAIRGGGDLRWISAHGLCVLGKATIDGVLDQLIKEGFEESDVSEKQEMGQPRTESVQSKKRVAMETLVKTITSAATMLKGSETIHGEKQRKQHEGDICIIMNKLLEGFQSSSWKTRHCCIECMGRILLVLPPPPPAPAAVPQVERAVPSRRPVSAPQQVSPIAATWADALRCLVGIFWNDWHPQVRTAAGKALSALGSGKSILDWVVNLLENEHPVRRVDALRTLARLGLPQTCSLPEYLKCFKDPFVTVRVEACKAACVLACPQKVFVNKLLDALEDPDVPVRAYAIKALGQTKSKNSHITEALLFHSSHESHPAIRAEACRAAAKLDLVCNNPDMIRALSDLAQGDVNERVRKEAESALTDCGLAVVPRSDGEPKPLTTATGGILPAAEESEAAVVNAVRALSTLETIQREALKDYQMGNGGLAISLSEDNEANAALIQVVNRPELEYRVKEARRHRVNLV